MTMHRIIRRIVHILVLGGSIGVALPARASSLPEASARLEDAAAAIRQYHRLCSRDAGRLWDTSLCGPILLVDPATRIVVADRNTPDGRLRSAGRYFTGTLPTDVPVANTSTEWAGLRWTMLLLPLPSDVEKRGELLMHEAFHRVQPQRLPPPEAALPAHLDGFEGRVAMRLEWRALSRALLSQGDARQDAIRDALAFRASRRRSTPDAAELENALEINEGLAEYTGVRLGGADPVRSAVAIMAGYDRRGGYTRSFAYASGPAYGLLLDATSPHWRASLRPDSDLGSLLQEAIGGEPVPGTVTRRELYGHAAVSREEGAAQKARDQQARIWTARLVDGPLVRLPLESMKVEFDPGTIFPLGSRGSVYPTAVIRDDWGTLTVAEGVLIASDWSVAAVAGPATMSNGEHWGPGWSLKLSPGWRIADGRVQRDSTSTSPTGGDVPRN